MNFDLTDEQEMVRDTFARFLDEHSSTIRVRAAHPSGFDPALWQGLGELGAFGMRVPEGPQLLLIFWLAVAIGVAQSIFWVNAPKWLSAVLYVVVGWLAVPYLPEMRDSLGGNNLILLGIGGVVYTTGAVIYALKRPNPWPKVLAYHELFHLLVIVAAIFHFIVISRLMK